MVYAYADDTVGNRSGLVVPISFVFQDGFEGGNVD